MRLKIINDDSWFAWHPVVIEDEIVWLERVTRAWNPKLNFRIIDICDPGDYDGGWEYANLQARGQE